MAYSLIGELFHEIAGITLFILFIIHHWLNRKWIMNLFKGKYNPRKIFQTVINLLLLVFMILQPVSGILMSRYILKDITISSFTATAREIHLLLAYWGYVLLSIHAGTHMGVIFNKIQKKNPAVYKAITIITGIIAIYGCYAFVKRGFIDYMFMRSAFVFFDFSEPIILFIRDYLCIMITFETAGYLINKYYSNK